MANLKDQYQKWEEDGILEEKLKLIQELVSKRVDPIKIAEALNISLRTLTTFKNKYIRVKNAFIFGNSELIDNLVDSIYKRAIGYEYEEVQTIIEETKTGTKKRIVKNKRHLPADVSASKYLLAIKGGIEYKENKEELSIMKERLEKGEEEWENGTDKDNDDKPRFVNRVRK